MKKLLFFLIAASMITACEKNNIEQQEEQKQDIPFDTASLSLVGKIYSYKYDGEEAWHSCNFYSKDSMIKYDTDKSDGTIGKYGNIQKLSYVFKYPIIECHNEYNYIQFRYTFIQDSTKFTASNNNKTFTLTTY